MSHLGLPRLLVFLSLCLVLGPATASRVALVIGNGAYTDTSALPNASNDGRAMAERLRGLGFEVFEGIDQNRGQMQSLIAHFSRALRDAEVGLFFYAGHGMQVEGENHLVPVNAVIKDDADLPFQTIPVDIILRQMERAVPTRLVFLDACRDNPLARSLARSLGGTSRSVSVDQGLAQMQAGIGTLIAYATEPDAVALDGEGSNSPFTTALLKHLDTPGLEVRTLLTRVRQDVLNATDNKQVPWDHSSLTGEFYFLPQSLPGELPTVTHEKPEVTPDPAMELAFWQSAQSIQEPAAKRLALEAYLARYPEGEFVALAQVLIGALAPPAPAVAEAAPEAESVPEPEPTPEPAVAMVTPPADPPEPAAPVSRTAEPAPDPEALETALNLDRNARLRVQQRLTVLGFDTYGADGMFGPNTRRAIRDYQQSRDLPVTGFLIKDQLLRLQDEAAPALARAAEAARRTREAREAEAGRRAREAREAEAARRVREARERRAARQAAPPAAPAAPPVRVAEPAAEPEPEAEKPINWAFRRCMMNYEKSYSDCVREHGAP